MRTLCKAWNKQTLSKLSLSPVLLSLHIGGRRVPRTYAPPASRIQGSLSVVFRTSYPQPQLPASAVNSPPLLLMPPEHSLLPRGLPALTSARALSAEPWAASLPLSQLPTPSRAWVGPGGRPGPRLPARPRELPLTRAQGKELAGVCWPWDALSRSLLLCAWGLPLSPHRVWGGIGGVVGRKHSASGRSPASSFQKPDVSLLGEVNRRSLSNVTQGGKKTDT